MTADGHYLGIDFGTSTIYVTRWNPRRREVRPVENLSRDLGAGPFIDSVIYYESPTHRVLGRQAFRRGLLDPLNAVEGVKRHIGDENWSIPIACLGEALSAESVAADMFGVLKERVEAVHGGEPIAGAVISVPFAFQSRERSSLRRAAERAGLPVLKLIEEPVAAAVCFGHLGKLSARGETERMLVFDLGGGTLDVTVFALSAENGGVRRLEVLNTDGHKHLGGKDVDAMLARRFQRLLGYDIAELGDARTRRKELFQLHNAAREFKENLARYGEQNAFCAELAGGRVLDMDIDRAQFDRWLHGHGFIGRIREVLENALSEVDLAPADVARVVLVGGASNIPPVQQALVRFFDRPLEAVIDPVEMVGHGAGLYCGTLLAGDHAFEVVTRLSHAIGIKCNRELVPMLPRNAACEQFSPVRFFEVTPHGDRPAHIAVYQGNSTDIDACTPIGTITVDRHAGRGTGVGIQLGTDADGIVHYRLYDRPAGAPFAEGPLH